MTTLPEEAVKAAASALRWSGDTLTEMATAALTAALPFLPVQGASAAREQALEEVKLERSIERWRGMKPSEVMKGSTAQITYALEDARKDILSLARALSSPDHPDDGKVDGDGIERAKFYHHQWPMKRLLEARRDGLVDHSGGEAWRYEYSHKDEHGKYDILYRHVKNLVIPARLPSAPASEGAE
jgi:hypothetical protein